MRVTYSEVNKQGVGWYPYAFKKSESNMYRRNIKDWSFCEVTDDLTQ